MKKIKLSILLISIFFLWRYSFEFQKIVEPFFNQVRLCNVTNENISFISFIWKWNHNREYYFSEIEAGECTGFKNSLLLERYLFAKGIFEIGATRYSFWQWVQDYQSYYPLRSPWKYTIQVHNFRKSHVPDSEEWYISYGVRRGE